MISIYNPNNNTWEIKTLAEAGIPKDCINKEKHTDYEKVGAAWNWISLNGVWVMKDDIVYYHADSVKKAIRLISFK